MDALAKLLMVILALLGVLLFLAVAIIVLYLLKIHLYIQPG